MLFHAREHAADSAIEAIILKLLNGSALYHALGLALCAGALTGAMPPATASPSVASPRQIAQLQGASGGEAASDADSFVDSIGFNAKFEIPQSLYATQFPTVKSLLGGAGIRHIRVGFMFNNPSYYRMMRDLAAVGVHGNYVTTLHYSQSQLLDFPAAVAPSLESYEGPNEPNQQGNADWSNQTRAFQQNLYSWVKGDPQTRQFTVIGPSVTNHFEDIGDMSPYMDYGNIHNYLDVFNPGTAGWGSRHPEGVYGSIDYNFNQGKKISLSKPVMSTETGYGAVRDGSKTMLNYRAQLRYMSRLFFEQFNHGVVRTYAYQFLDNEGLGLFDRFGIVQHDLTPKPAYTAIKSIISVLSDPGPRFTPTPMAYQLSGETSNIAHTLLQKRNGDYILAVWLEKSSWNPHGGGDISVPDQTVSLTAQGRFSRATLYTMDESGRFTTSSEQVSANTTSFRVSDKVSLLTLSR